MNSAARAVDYPCVIPFNDPGHQQLQISKDSGDTVNISPLPASIPSSFGPLLLSVTSRTSPRPAATVSPRLRSEIASSTRGEWNAAQPSDTAQDKPQGTENEARLKSVPPVSQPQSQWTQKESKEVKPINSGQGRLRSHKTPARYVTDKEMAAAKIHRRARKHARRQARAAKAVKVNEQREALAAKVDRSQRLWLAARRRRARISSMSVVVHRRAATYEPLRTGSKSAPAQRRRPRQDLNEETDGEGWPEADETMVTHMLAVPCNPPILYKPPGSGAKSAPGQRLVILPRELDLSDETDDEGRHYTEETVEALKHVVPQILNKPPGSGAKPAPGQRLVIVPPLPARHDSSDESGQDEWSDESGQDDWSDESGQDDWSDVDETMPSVTSESLERDSSRMLQHKLSFEELMRECFRWPNGHEPMRVLAEEDRGYDETQYERAEDSYDSGYEAGLDSGEETEEEDWSNINPKTLLTRSISRRFG